MVNFNGNKTEEKNRTYKVITCILFAAVMITGCILGFLIPYRPVVSEYEKRELEQFPTFSLEGLADGKYTDGISTWYSDTFPYRDTLIMADRSVKTLYGLNADSVENVAEGDDIPDFPSIPSAPDVTEPSESKEPATQEKSTSDEDPGSKDTVDDSTEPVSDESSSETEETSKHVQSTEYIDGQEIYNMNPQEAGNVNLKDMVGYCVYGFNLNAANIYCETVAEVQKELPRTQVYDILIPNNSYVLLDEATKKEWRLSDEDKVIKYFSNYIYALNDQVICIPILDELINHKDEYLYFKTDHHWTQLGAYYSFCEFLKEKGWEIHEISEYTEIVMENFLGSYYSSSGYSQLQSNPDTIYAYEPLTTNQFEFFDTAQGRWRSGKIVRDLSSVQPTQKYQAFIYGDCPIEYIRNSDLNTGRSAMVVKESFGNPFVPFLADYYDKVIVIDYRGYKDSIISLAEEEGIDDIIFINNLEAISDTNTMNVMKSICQRPAVQGPEETLKEASEEDTSTAESGN